MGVSGGIDSMVLLHLLRSQLSPEQIVIAHFNHLVRPTSTQEVTLLRKRCEEWGLKSFFSAARKGLKVSEASLRKERLAFLQKIRKETGSRYLVLGHHADDQLETVLMRLIRGTGLYGLGGMRSKQGFVVRPLLQMSRREIETYAKKYQIKVIEDETNSSEIYFRNLIRKKLIPVVKELSSSFGGESKLLARLSGLTETIHAHKKQDEKKAIQWMKKHGRMTPTWITFPLPKWKKLTIPIQELVMQNVWRRFSGETLEKKHLQQLFACINHSKKAFLSKSVRVVPSCGLLYLEFPQHRVQQQEMLKCARLIDLVCSPQNKKLVERFLEVQQAELRFIKPGDCYQGKKIKRKFLKEKIPLMERALLPVVAIKGSKELLWYFPRKDGIGQAIWVPWSSLN